MGGNDYNSSDAARDTGTSDSKAEAAWEQAAQDDAAGSSGKTLDEVAPGTSREEVSHEGLAEAESANED